MRLCNKALANLYDQTTILFAQAGIRHGGLSYKEIKRIELSGTFDSIAV